MTSINTMKPSTTDPATSCHPKAPSNSLNINCSPLFRADSCPTPNSQTLKHRTSPPIRLRFNPPSRPRTITILQTTTTPAHLWTRLRSMKTRTPPRRETLPRSEIRKDTPKNVHYTSPRRGPGLGSLRRMEGACPDRVQGSQRDGDVVGLVVDGFEASEG